MKTREIIEILATGVDATIQDLGRKGWRRFGVPLGGAMDQDAALAANQLLNNPVDAPVFELLYGGAKLRFLENTVAAITGAAAGSSWHSHEFVAGQVLPLTPASSGLWTYIAVPGGFDVPRVLGSASTYRRGGLGPMLRAGDILRRCGDSPPKATAVVSADYGFAPTLPVWMGPQWELFDEASREALTRNDWKVTPESDRVGYRLSGPTLRATSHEIPSEPVPLGSIQVPANGQAIVTMRDGPTVGGYPKIAVLDPSAVSRFAQCAPGTLLRFKLVE